MEDLANRSLPSSDARDSAQGQETLFDVVIQGVDELAAYTGKRPIQCFTIKMPFPLYLRFKGLNQQPLHFREISPMVFREVDGPAKVAFVSDPTGRRVAYIDYPFMVFQQVNSAFDKQTVNYVIMGFSLSVIALTLPLNWLRALVSMEFSLDKWTC